MKKILSAVLAVVMILSMCSVMAFAEEENDYDCIDGYEHTSNNGMCDNCNAFIIEVGGSLSLSIVITGYYSNPTWELSSKNAAIIKSESDVLISFSGVAYQTKEIVEIEGVTVGTDTLTLYTSGSVYTSATIVIVPHQTHINTTVTGMAATCTEAGLTDGAVCSYCGEIIMAQTEIPALGHDYETVVTAPTCTEQGYTTYTCSVCGDNYVGDYVEATGHDYTTVVTVPTCTEQGYTTYTCFCGDTYVDEYVEATGHDYSTSITAPTCTEQGYTTYTCSCGDSYVDDHVEAVGHASETVSGYAATCTETGLTDGEKCSACGEILTTQTEIPATGHDYDAVVTAPTCTEKGYTTYTCSVCDDCYIADYVDSLPEETTEPTSDPTTEPTFILGDVNGDGNITAADARIVLRISAKLEKMEDYNLPLEVFDVSVDEKITAADARKILRISAKLE